MTPPQARLVQLAAGSLRAELAPEVGGSLTRFEGEWRQGGRSGRVDWLRPASEQGLAQRDPMAMASFPLVPFCNRIRNGRAGFEGREILFPPNHPSDPSPHPLHGIGWQRPWSLLQADATHATLGLEVASSPAWPWSFSARQQYRLSEDGLQFTISVSNRDSAAMPAGIGHHPYFPHLPGTRVTSPTAAMWQTDSEVMPTTWVVNEVVRQLREGILLSTVDLDNNFIGWEHRALVEWPADERGSRRSIVIEAQAPLDYFVLYCPRAFDHFCAEPVSQCTDWLNLLPRFGREPLGGASIAPGETLQASFTLTPRWY